MSKHSIKYGSAAVVVASVLWALDGLLRRHLYSLPAPVIVFWEHIFGLIVLVPIIAYSWKAYKQLTRKQWYAIALVSLLSGAAGTILYTAALGQINFIPFSVVVLLQQLNPIFAIATAAILLRERLSRRFLGLSALALIGAYLVSFPELKVTLSTGNGTLMAALMAVGAAAAWGSATAFSKYALKDTSFLHITAARFALAPVFALFFVVGSGSTASLTALTGEQVKYLLFITFSTGLLALAIYYYGLQRIEASRAAILGLARPLAAVIIGWLFLNEGFTATQAFGALVLTATTLAIIRDTKETPAPTPKILP